MRGAGDLCFAAYALPESTTDRQTVINVLTGTIYTQQIINHVNNDINCLILSYKQLCINLFQTDTDMKINRNADLDFKVELH